MLAPATFGSKKFISKDSLEDELRRAVREMAFELHYQPQINIRSRSVTAFEALLRWRHPLLGFIPTDEFIAVAEEAGLIKAIGGWVLTEACREASFWPSGIKVAVNVSPAQIAGGTLPQTVDGALLSSGLHPSRLEIEITESLLIQGDQSTVQSLQAIRAKGVRIALDDFGTGYSSLSYLPQFRFDKIKIDRSFVHGLGKLPGRSAVVLAIVRAVTGICADLGMTCTAEGVETDEQLAVLSSENCTDVQGHLFSEALPPQRIPDFLQRMGVSSASDLKVRPPAPGISFFQIAQTANDVIVVTTADLDEPGPTIVYVNPAFTKVTGFSAAEAIGLSPRILQGAGTSRSTLDTVYAELKAGKAIHQKILNYDKHGAPYWLDMRIMPLRDTEGTITHFAAIERDISLSKRCIVELEVAADRDVLTGLPDRHAFLRMIGEELDLAQRLPANSSPRGRACLAYVEIVGLPPLTAARGQKTPDALLIGVADRLTESVRRADVVGRIGGADLVVWMPSVSLPDARAISRRLQKAMVAMPFATESGLQSISINVGIASWKDGDDLETLLIRAKSACRREEKIPHEKRSADIAFVV